MRLLCNLCESDINKQDIDEQANFTDWILSVGNGSLVLLFKSLESDSNSNKKCEFKFNSNLIRILNKLIREIFFKLFQQLVHLQGINNENKLIL